MSAGDTDLGTPWARRHWAAADHMTVRGHSRRSSGPSKRRPVAGHPRSRAERAASNGTAMRALGSAYPLFATRLAGHDPEYTGLVPAARVVLPELVFRTAPPVALHAAGSAPRPFAERSTDVELSMPARRLPVLPVQALPAPVPYASGPGLRERLVARWRDWRQLIAWRGLPRDVDWVGWRDRAEPTLFVSFALIGSAAVLIGLYSFSNGGLYNPITSVPSQTNGPPPEAAPDAVPPGVRAIHPLPGAQPSTPASSGSSVPQAYVSWPAPGILTNGSSAAGQATRPAPGSGPGSAVPTRTHPAGGGGGGSTPTATPTVTATSTPTVTDTATPTPSDTATPTPSDTATTTATPGP